MTLNLSNIPWWAAVIVALIASGGTYMAVIRKSNDEVQRTMVTQAVARQQQLDERQEKMMNDLSMEIGRLKDDQLIVRKELSEERAANRVLNESMETLKDKNEQLTVTNLELVRQVKELTATNLELVKQIKELQMSLAKFESSQNNEKVN